MSASVLLQAIGLNIQPNQLDPNSVPAGSLTIADNVIIRRDNVIESRRGYKLYGQPFGTGTDRAKQLATYKNRLLRHYASTLQFDTQQLDPQGQSIFDSFFGSYLEPQVGRRIRFIEANSNFYFTTSDGIKKISALTANDLSSAVGVITDAGGIKALDLSTTLDITLGDHSGWFVQDSAVAYRVVWGTIDNNNNLILGTPSERSVIFNSLTGLLLRDYQNVLAQLDNVSDNIAFPSLIDDGDYVATLGLNGNSTPSDLFLGLTTLVTKLDNDILYANDIGTGAPLQMGPGAASITGSVVTITFTVGNPQDYFVSGQNIFLQGFTATTGTINGAQIVSTVTPTTITFNTTATGPVTNTLATINSYTFSSIVVPTAPSIPATDAQLVGMQSYLSEIITQLQLETTTGTPPTISADSHTKFIDDLDITTTATVSLDITIPQGITTNYFFQIYRSPLAIATGVSPLSDVSPSDELQLVFEGFPTSAQIAAGFVIVQDITPDAFRGANLYTNATTGQGILQANDIPPAALDINYFKNVTFYANTRTRHRLAINLLGVANMITDFNNGITPSIVIASATSTNTYYFVTGLSEITQITTTSGATLASSGPGTYFLINSPENLNQYYVWYQVGTSVDPMVPNKTGIRVEALTSDTAGQIATKTTNAFNTFNFDFTASNLSNVMTVTSNKVGVMTHASAGTSTFAFVILQNGRGEDSATNSVLLSTSISPGTAVDETARSLERVINRNTNEVIYAYYLSAENGVPGKLNFEARSLTTNPFYVVANNSNTGLSFNPDLSPEEQISSISAANPTVITTSSAHNLINKDQVVIVGTNSTPKVDGLYTITYISPTSFSIPVNVTVPGTIGAIRKAVDAPVSDNEVLVNRIYYSKILQPEAVPTVNTIDVGAKDKAILRIFPLRDSLFVFKEDGLFRISGEQSPFSLALFDSSVIVLAPDSVDVSNNLVYAWTTKGIEAVSEAGVNLISRPIDLKILSVATPQYTNFTSATWGIGYESDNSYTVYSVSKITDVYATVGYRYSTLTNTWTTFSKTDNCGVINPEDRKQYLGAGDVNFIEQERKDFARYDYADRELSVQLTTGNFFGTEIRIEASEAFAPGDVLVQNQFVTIYDFNSLLQKMDIDPTLDHDYLSTQKMFGGDDPRVKLDALIDKLANDPTRLAQPGATSAATYEAFESITTLGTITSISADDPTIITSAAHGLQNGRIITIAGSNSVPSVDGKFPVTVLNANQFTIDRAVTVPGTTGTFTVENSDFQDIQASYNNMIITMNNDTGVAFSNYSQVTRMTTQESIITTVTTINNLTKRIIVNLNLDYVIGPLIIFKSIPTTIAWTPQTFGDALGLKHMREATLIFENKAFTEATMSFSSDLLPRLIDVDIPGDGNGIFGYSGNTQGFGSNFFGGGSNSAPFRTYIPRDCQRCRYLVCQFTHNVAREEYAIFGLSLTGEISQSTRAYR